MRFSRARSRGAGFSFKIFLITALVVSYLSLFATHANIVPGSLLNGLPTHFNTHDFSRLHHDHKVQKLIHEKTSSIEQKGATSSNNVEQAMLLQVEEEPAEIDIVPLTTTTTTTLENIRKDTTKNTKIKVSEVINSQPSTPKQQKKPSVTPNKPSKASKAQNDGGATNTITTTKDVSNKYHIIMSSGGGPYAEWQSRAAYYWYKKLKASNPESAMGGFTRLLHNGVSDEWMDEIPTIVVKPLPADLQAIAAGYVVLDRPYGFQQFVHSNMKDIEEPYILMAEPDHLFLKPPPLMATPTTAAAFPFTYMEPQSAKYAPIIERFNKKQVPISNFLPIGNSPVMIHKDAFASVVDLWVNTSLALKQDPEADQAWGWIIEMYAYSIASTQVESGPIQYDLHPEFILQPPFDEKLTSHFGAKPAYIIHYTYGNDFDENGIFTPGKVGYWHWDKRDYSYSYPPIESFKPLPEGCTNDAVKALIRMLKEAAQNLPGWEERVAQQGQRK